MYRRYQENPKAVGESWREFFEDYTPISDRSADKPPAEAARVEDQSQPVAKPLPNEVKETPQPDEGPRTQPSQVTGSMPATKAAAPTGPQGSETAGEDASPLRGIAARIAENMEASLGVPTATSVRTIPAKLLEENRRIINNYLASSRGGGKLSFTHMIGFAILKALEARPGMKVSYAEIEGKPHVLHHKRMNFGLAVDVEKEDGNRILYVPNIKAADQLDFQDFFSAYEGLIRKVRSNKLEPDDFAGTNVTLTNPGTVGTAQSVPRLMPGQGVIVGVGTIAYPPEYQAADPRQLARLGVGKIVTITSTYDHRVIQGAESGQFLGKIQDLLLGADRFYDDIFASLRIPYQPVRWSVDLAAADETEGKLEKQSRVIQLINMYRVRGHLLADLNPIGWEVLTHPELDLAHYGLTVWDLDREFLTDGLPGPRRQPLRQIVDHLRDAYCRTLGWEYMHISDPEQKRWIQKRVETQVDDIPFEDKKHLLERLNAAESFEKFLQSKYPGNKRFSLEGAESLIPMMDFLLEQAADGGMIETVIGMPHRGRLNVLANIVGKPLREIFREFEGEIDPNTVQGSGDVKYHLGMTGRFTSRKGNDIGVVLASNPSHLEAVNPVVEGMTRAKQDLISERGWEYVMPVLLHGDAAFAGQGVVAETFNLSALRGFRTGGTVHIVVNNLIGFTTAPTSARSSTYATDIAKMIAAPIIHVNGDDPEACARAIKTAFEYRQAFHRDVVIDLVCYRKWGHNESDEPAFTQPLMYAKIEERRSVRKLYTELLLNRGDLTVEDTENILEDFKGKLKEAFEETRGSKAKEEIPAVPPKFDERLLEPVDTGVERERLEHIHGVLTSFPPGFEPHPKLKRLIEKRSPMLEQDAIDWSGAEALAFGSLLMEGSTVRLSGQDSRRGTFSQRHSVLVDYRTGEELFPLSRVGDDQGRFRTHDSNLSEFAVLGFEYGYSIGNGDALVMWEAQFGDFVNGAQVVIDQFIVAGEDKWAQNSGLVMLLPHGYEGQGPEHSSARLERFLTLAAEGSIQVTQPTTPAQYFHLLRRQITRSVRKPLVILTPKSLLRQPDARSATVEFTAGHFRETLDDPKVEDRSRVRRILLCTGKIAYAVDAERAERDAPVAIVRLEQLYPFPEKQLAEIFSRYPEAREVYWVQDEPENMGAWTFIHARFDHEPLDAYELTCVSRAESASPATGSARVHEQEQEQLVAAAFSNL
ncbi:MAG: multifunctional oxoglutarate decarboxylase/oxoglutarate dehydrogenase thiamine pyrophosphate-binding subunit/dihydrolipoyllysine-residue succinyltransferase subunit [Actinobacteria bacterium]|nr:multifunctional oxoglutarate decarboxylase/oxoglutarate dehydrogenase thiamine pyrophosphate-binding subunit/dihydrolipoyllysine-residue succinyltransferase subunit [Actinomycetota bacterium]